MAVILPSTYTDGTAVCTNGSPNVVGTGTMWVNTILPGDFFWASSGESVRVLAVVDDTNITLAYNWPGATQATGPYEIRFQADQGRVQETTRQLLERMQSGNLYAFAGLAGLTDTVPYFTGPGAMGLLTRQDLTNGVHFDIQVDTLPDRDDYDNETTGFVVFVSDMGDGRSAIFTKMSVAPGDWSDPAYITGPRGLTWLGAWSNVTSYHRDDAVSYNGASFIALTGNLNVTPVSGATWGVLATRGATGLTGMNPRGTYSAVTAYDEADAVLYNGSTFVALQATTGNAPPTLPTTSNAYWQLVAIKGTDGTGTGDVVGPAGVVDGSAAMFDTTTGKLIKAATPSQFATWLALTAAGVSFDNSVANIPGNPTTVQAAIVANSTAGGKNDAIFALEIADLKGQRQGMVGGVADAFDDRTGIYDGTGGSDANTITMLHFDGANGSVVIADDGVSPRHWVPVGNTQISTAQSKFGGASLAFDGANDFVYTVVRPGDFAFGTGDFTIDAQVRFTTVSATQILCDFRSSGPMISPVIYLLASGRIAYFTNSAERITGTTVLTVNTWYHVAVSRVSGITRLFLNGVQEGASYIDANVYTAAVAVYLGSVYDGTGELNGFLDEFRVSTVGRYAANFTPPVAAYSIDAAASANYTYDATNDRFTPFVQIVSQVPTMMAATTAGVTVSSNKTSAAGFEAWRAFDGSNPTTNSNAWVVTSPTGTSSLSIDFGASNSKIVNSYGLTPRLTSSDGQLYMPVAWTFEGSDDNSTWTTLDTRTNQLVASWAAGVKRSFTFANSTTYRYYRFNITSYNSASFLIIGEAELISTTTTNMTLVSTTYPTASVPTTARASLQLADSVSLTPNTDFTMEVSRDDGVTYSSVTLALSMSFSGVKMYEGSVSVSGQPSGSNMKWRMKSLTNKNVIASGVVLQQS